MLFGVYFVTHTLYIDIDAFWRLLCSTHTHTHTHTQTLRGRASRTPGAAARVVEENKQRSHAAGGTRGYRFVPLAIETYGRLGCAAVEVLGEWADAAAGNGAFDPDAYLTWVKRELSVT